MKTIIRKKSNLNSDLPIISENNENITENIDINVPEKKIIKSKPKPNSNNSEQSYLGNKSIEDIYQQKDFRTQIRDLPDSYIGSIQPNTEELWVPYMDTEENRWRMHRETVTTIEGFYTIFNEAVTNALDHNIRLKQLVTNKEVGHEKITHFTKNIYVNIDISTGRIEVSNDGMGIDIVKHQESGLYIPEMIFGNLLTSANYDTSKEKEVAGKNGVGIKLANIFSSEFSVETVDSIRKLKYFQKWSNAMTSKTEPVINKFTKAPYTTVSFIPDFERFNIKDHTKIDDWKIFHKRIFDAVACTGKDVTIWYNKERISIKTFDDYVEMYLEKRVKKVQINNDKWNVIMCLSPVPNSFEHISFVNGIFTDRGGKHVSHVIDNVSKNLADYLNEKLKKGSAQITNASIKNNLMVFIKATIINPSFDTQTKRFLTTSVANFGSKCDITPDVIEKLSKIGITDRAKQLVDFNAKIQSGISAIVKKGQKIYDEKYHPAYYSKSNPKKCTLVLTEGDSAVAFVRSGVKGMSDESQKYWGWFPLKGKPLNVRDASPLAVSNNIELKKIASFMGLQTGKKYNTPEELKSLNYGRIMILSDADDDGYHIKGLIINYIHFYWPDLIKIDGFICTLATAMYRAYIPVKNKQGVPQDALIFYTSKEYNIWKDQNYSKKWEIVYYKGLSTSSSSEASYYFSDKILPENLIGFKWDHDEAGLSMPQPAVNVETEFYITENADNNVNNADNITDINNANNNTVNDNIADNTNNKNNSKKIKDNDFTNYHIKLAFAKGYEDLRKDWIDNYNLNKINKVELGYENKLEKISTFINDRLILYSVESVKRSVPHLLDGLKPSNRKIMFSAFKKKLIKTLKVAQFAGYVGEHASYHHGEKSLTETITKMAQNYVGKNNINLLYPCGQFGTRYLNGKDAGSPRYISTALSNITQYIYHKSDMPLYEMLQDDGKNIEPLFYVPIIPMILVNGADGIGTGYSTFIPQYNPVEIIQNIRSFLDGQSMKELIPFYRGFKGIIKPTDDGKFFSIGEWTKIDNNRIQITEIPLGGKKSKSFTSYKEFLYSLMDDKGVCNLTKEILMQNEKATVKLKGGKTKKTNVKPKTKKKTSKKDDTTGIKKDGSTENETETSDSVSSTLKGVVTDVDIIKETDTEMILNVTFKDGWLDNELANSNSNNNTNTTDSNSNSNYSFEKKIKLINIITITNMYLFNKDNVIKKYTNPLQILEEFLSVRMLYYTKRKNFLLKEIEYNLQLATIKYKFISEYIEGILLLNKKKKTEMEKILKEHNYPSFSDIELLNPNKNFESLDSDFNSQTQPQPQILPEVEYESDNGKYNYLLSMPFYSLTEERLTKLKNDITNYNTELNILKSKTEKDLYIADLDILQVEYDKFMTEWYSEFNTTSVKQKNIKTSITKKIVASKSKSKK